MQTPRGTLDQWRTLQAVVDYGGYAQAAEQLFRSQSTVSYAVTRLQEQLGIQLLEVKGRKAELTKAGEVLLRRSRRLVKDAIELEELAANLSKGREAEIHLVVDAAFPTPLLMQALKQFAPHSAGTRVQLKEVVLSGADEALESGQADLVISGRTQSEFLCDLLYEAEFVAVAHPQHVLHKLDRQITVNDLSRELQVVIRDSGVKHNVDAGWLGAEHRWTVTSLDSATEAITTGLGFGWLPRHQVDEKIKQGELKELGLSEGKIYQSNLYLIFGKPQDVGPATRQFADILRNVVLDAG